MKEQTETMTDGSYCPSCTEMYATPRMPLARWEATVRTITCGVCGEFIMPIEVHSRNEEDK